jgi:hypothetical protein
MALDQLVPIVENAISKIGVPLEDARSQTPMQWNLQYGSVEVLLILKNSQTLNGDKPIFIGVAPIMPLPKDPQQLTAMYQDILELSHSLVVCRFSVANNHLFMSAGRFAEGMDSDEVLELMQQLATNANAIDDRLKEKYPSF